MEKLAPICLFTYNRLEETIQTVTALKANSLAKESDLIIFSDGPKKDSDVVQVKELRDYLKTINGFKLIKINESTTNKGLAHSIIKGVTKVIDKYGKIIVLEDDLITTPNFLSFMNQALNFYDNNKRIYAVNGYSPLIEGVIEKGDKIYFHVRSSSWGWATWDDRWDDNVFDKSRIREVINENDSVLKKFDNEAGKDASRMLLGALTGRNNSWYIRWVFHNFIHDKISVYPILSKVLNVGFNSEATHCTGISAYKAEMDLSNNKDFEFDKIIDLKNKDYRFLKYFSRKYKFIFRIKLLASLNGRKMVFNELRTKLNSSMNIFK